MAGKSEKAIRITGACEHNLKNISLSIPRDKMVVITGISGSGKSSLAFDTVYAEVAIKALSVRVNAGLTADCTSLDINPDTGNLTQTRPAIGGNILATIETPTARPQMATSAKPMTAWCSWTKSSTTYPIY